MSISVITPECINEVMNTKANDNPKVGMGATMFVGSDRYPMVVVKVLSKKTVEVAHVSNEFMNKFYTDDNGIMTLPKEYLNKIIELGNEKYDFGKSYYAGITYTLRKNGRWMPKGENLWGTSSVRFGYADEYMDPCF